MEILHSVWLIRHRKDKQVCVSEWASMSVLETKGSDAFNFGTSCMLVLANHKHHFSTPLLKIKTQVLVLFSIM